MQFTLDKSKITESVDKMTLADAPKAPQTTARVATSADELVVTAQRSEEERKRAEEAMLCSLQNKDACTMCSS